MASWDTWDELEKPKCEISDGTAKINGTGDKRRRHYYFHKQKLNREERENSLWNIPRLRR